MPVLSPTEWNFFLPREVITLRACQNDLARKLHPIKCKCSLTIGDVLESTGKSTG